MISIYDLNPLFQDIYYSISPEILSTTPQEIRDYFQYNYYFNSRHTNILTPIPSDSKITIEKTNSYFNRYASIDFPLAQGLDFKKKLWIHPNCTIARAQVAKKYTIVRKRCSADFCVIPKSPESVSANVYAIFINKEKSKVYLIKEERVWDAKAKIMKNKEVKIPFPIGTRLSDINPSLKTRKVEDSSETNYIFASYDKKGLVENWEDLLNSEFYFCGNCLDLSKNLEFVADFTYNKLHNLVTEDTVMKTLGDSSNQLDETICESIKSMLSSTDDDVVGLGLKTLAEMDYIKYYNTTMYLLCNTSLSRWSHCPMKNNTSIKFMLETLDLYRYPREHYSKTITQEDFDLMCKIASDNISSELEDVIERFKRRFPFAQVDISKSVTISPNLNDDGEEDSNKID